MLMMNKQIALRLAIVVATVMAPVMAQCGFEVREGQIIDPNVSEKAGAVFLGNTHSEAQEDCENACCNWEGELEDGTSARCNLAVSDSRNKGTKKAKNCFLVFCPSEAACKMATVHGFNASFVTQRAVQETTQEEETTESSTLLPEVDLTSSAISEQEKSSKEQPASTEPTAGPSASPSQSTVSNNSDSQEATSSDAFPRTFDTNQTMVSNDTAASVDEPEEDYGEEEMKSGSTNKVIDSNGALIAAICFGMLFLIAVLVVMSKHWYEAYQRRHYSKVDYLINGMYK